ncbi:acylamino-acid-releasing enzyme 1-like isoform X2 [Asparagus officinalis]|uniref:acylamino-acid-releasing enzyme 1-like isoform X2 n=1 Tax=Asparagus officinalis TaxID=4686 RepID=UPI00098DEFCC|nr:acylamino-acid-releasing enzyme 1-like isoform X2 [Asparagus officinalis]
MAAASIPTAQRFRLSHLDLLTSFPSPKLKSLSRSLRFDFASNPSQVLASIPAMQATVPMLSKESPMGVDATTVEEYASQAKLLQEFSNIPTINKAWIFKSEESSRAMFSFSQPNIVANKKRTFIHSSHISKTRDLSVSFEWSPFPIQMDGVSTLVPSPSGTKLLVVRNKEDESPTVLEIWGQYQLEKEIHIPQSVHGSIYTDEWFGRIAWNHEENLIAYVAEEPVPSKPVFNDLGYKKEGSADKDYGSWKGQGDWEEHWGETYAKKRKPSLFVVNTTSGEAQPVKGIPKSLSAGQVIWAPSTSSGSNGYLVFVGWLSENGPQQTPRKLGIKYCYNRPCALYAIKAPFHESNTTEMPFNADEVKDNEKAVNLTQALSSAFFPQFSPDGRTLVFLSVKSAVDSGAHSATNSLHKLEWPADGKPDTSSRIIDVVPIVMCPEDGCFPGLYWSNFVPNPWLSDECTMVLTSVWGSTQAILSVNILSCKVSRISPDDTIYSWNVLALDGDNIIAECSSPVDPPQTKYGFRISAKEQSAKYEWLDVSSPLQGYSDKIRSFLSSHQCTILKIPVSNHSENLTKGARRHFDAIFVSCAGSKSEESFKGNENTSACNPVIVILHGGPHSVSLSTYTKSGAFLSSLGYNLLIVNYRGSLGFGEEALQSLPGKAGSQDVNDVLTALDYAIEKGLVDASKVAVLGGSHGGFLTTHLIGQAPDRFVVAAVRNPVCNLSLMVGTSDIPDWCYVEAFGTEGKKLCTEAPSSEHLNLFYNKSPISHLSKVKTPTLFLLGAQDLRVPVSNGLQYARALREKGVELKVIVFPDDTHGIERPQSDFESFLNIGVWFKKYCK